MIYKYKTTITAAAGSGSANTNSIIGGVCKELLVKPTTSTTIYKFNIVDEDGITIKSYDFKGGQYIDTTEFIAYGIYTVNITNSSVDEDFTFRMMVREG